MPSPPPPTALRKFTPLPVTLIGSASSIVLAQAADTFPANTLAVLRTALLNARTLAHERLVIRDSNRRNLSERQVAWKISSEEEATKVKEQELRKQQQRDDKESQERDRNKRRESTAENGTRANGLDASHSGVDQVRLKERHAKGQVDRVLALVKVNGRERSKLATNGTIWLDDDGDEITSDAPSSNKLNNLNGSSSSSAVNDTLPHSAASTPLLPGMTRENSSDLDDDAGQPIRRKASLEKKRKHVIVDSDDSSAENGTREDPVKKIRKIGEHSARDSSVGTPAPKAGPSTHGPEDEEVKLKISLADPNRGLSYLRRKLKEDTFAKHSIPTRPPAQGTASAFYIPTNSLVPPEPISIPPVATPKRQSDVSEDFSKAKPGTQIAFHTFHTWAESYLRPFGEDDLAFLAPRPEDMAPYVLPAFGKPYLERWEDEDAGSPYASTSYLSPLEPPPLSRLRPDHLTEDSLGMEDVYVGPLTERLMSALAFDHEDGSGGAVWAEEKENELVEGSVEERKPSKPALDAVDLEERIKRELRFIGILGEEDVDWSMREDDEISSSLRACQRLLHRQTAINEARKSILTDIVKDRMGYQEYEATRDAQERLIENGWNKRQRVGSKKKGKSKEQERERVKDQAILEANGGARPPVSLALIAAIQTREKLVGQFQPFFSAEEEQGRFYGIPERSVFEEIERVTAEE